MKARIWFEARGRSARARGLSWPDAKITIGLYQLPTWAQRAFARGHLMEARGEPVTWEQAVRASITNSATRDQLLTRQAPPRTGLAASHGPNELNPVSSSPPGLDRQNGGE